MWGSNVLYCLVLLLLVVAVQGKKAKSSAASKSSGDSSSSSDNGRFDIIVEKLKTNSYIPLTEGNFSRFVVDRPRNYHAVLMFTATAAKYQCSVCVQAKKSFADAAGYYREQYDIASVPENKHVVFFLLEVDNARQIFNDMGLETVPRIYALPPTRADSPKMKMGEYELEVRSLLEGVGNFLQALEAMTKVPVAMTISSLPILAGLGFVAYLLALLAAAAAEDPANAVLWYQSPKIWAIFSILCFGVGVSGSIFCIIRSAPLYGADRQGVRIFAGAGREQYLVEGVLVALMTVGCGISGLLIYYGTKLPIGPLRHVVVILAMSCFVVLCLEIGEAYIDKTRWYSVKETVDKPVWEYMTSTVKKNSGLVKRMLRLSEIWLVEYKDWAGFMKKVQSLLVDYVKREALALLTFGARKT